MDTLGISVSKLCRYEDFLKERWGVTQENFIEYLQGLSVATPEQQYGSAYHTLLEKASNYQTILDEEILDPNQAITINGFHISQTNAELALRVYGSIPKPNLREVPVSKTIQVDGYNVEVRGRVDVIAPDGLYDYKTTGTKPTWQKYCLDSSQHHWYLWLCNMHQFAYDVFYIKDGVNGARDISYERYITETDKHQEAKLMETMALFIQFLKQQNLTDLLIKE